MSARFLEGFSDTIIDVPDDDDDFENEDGDEGAGPGTESKKDM